MGGKKTRVAYRLWLVIGRSQGRGRTWLVARSKWSDQGAACCAATWPPALAAADVDLAVLDTASPILAMEVLRHHRILLDHQPQLLENFIVKTLGAYFDLKQVRRRIEEALRRHA